MPRKSAPEIKKVRRDVKNLPRAERRTDATHVVIGRKPVFDVATHSVQRIVRLVFTPAGAKWFERACGIKMLDRVPHTVLEQQAFVEEVGEVGYLSHQGCVAYVKPRTPLGLAELRSAFEGARGASIWWALAGVTDVRNLGAIIRVASCFGSAGVILPNHRSAGLTPAVSRASAGASEFVPLYTVPTLNAIIEPARRAGIALAAAMCSEDAEVLGARNLPERIIIVLGSEGEGVPPLLASRCDTRVIIPMHGVIDSLNVAQAAAVIGWEWRRGNRDS